MKEKCRRCNGTGVVKAVGAWVTIYDTDRCPRCNGTGEEPKKKDQKEQKAQI